MNLARLMPPLSSLPRQIMSATQKHLWIIRHGQATHNPKAELAKANGCSHEEFMELMRQDDSLDSELTELGRNQVQRHNSESNTTAWPPHGLELIVSSPLSRALQTADLVLPPDKADDSIRRVCFENFREINGWLLNAKRRTKRELSEKFPLWSFHELPTENDVSWTDSLELTTDCAERGYEGLRLLLERPEQKMALVSHGGILRYMMNDHPYIKLVDERRANARDKAVDARFANGEIRKYCLSWDRSNDADSHDQRRHIVLEEIDF